MDIEFDLRPKIQHLADVVMIVSFKHVDIRGLCSQCAIEGYGSDPGGFASFVPPLARLRHDIDILKHGARFIFYKSNIQHPFSSIPTARVVTAAPSVWDL